MIPNEMMLTILISSVLLFHIFVGYALEDVYVITRNSGPKDQVWNGKDTFEIPPSKCNPLTASIADECELLGADAPTSDMPKCCCPCPGGSPTFAFLKNQWACLDNQFIRVLQDCNHTSYFLNEPRNPPSQLWALQTSDSMSTNIPNNGLQSCEVLPNSSWYLGCNGTRVKSPLYQSKMKDLFALANHFDDVVFNYVSLEVRGGVLNAHLLEGKIINLGIRCNLSNSNAQFHSCLMFKLKGQQICPEPEPKLYTRTTRSPEIQNPNRNISPKHVNTSSSPGNVHFRPSQGHAGILQGRRIIGVIAAIIVSIVFLIVIIASLFYRRRHPPNKKAKANKARVNGHFQDAVVMNRQSNSTIQQENKNEYNELSNWATRQPQIYARKYNVPLRREHNGIAQNTVLPLNPPVEENMKRPENSRELDPDYKDFEQQSNKGKTGLQNGCIRLDQPVYNILEELPTQGEPNMNMKRPENSRELDPDYKDFEQQSTKGKTGLQNGCIRLDQPVYNILEELSTQGEPMTLNNCDNKAVKQVLQRLHPENATENCNGGCSKSKGHSPVKEPKEHTSDDVEREYKVLEGPTTEEDTFHSGANSSKGPLYYTQEEPRQNDPHGEQGKNDQHQGDRVYHVLEENTYLNTFQFPNGTF